jgi:ligand-binding sensor domain-containing protein
MKNDISNIMKAKSTKGVLSKKPITGAGNVFIRLFILLFAALPLNAQELPLKNYTAQDEINPLPKSPVISTYQDSLGYLWVANYGLGLVRYDGQKMESYNGDESVLGSQIFEMRGDGYGRLWVISSDRGLSVSERPLSAYMNGSPVQFTDSLGGTALYRKLITFPLNVMATDARGRLWLGTETDGIIRYRFNGPDTVVADTIRTGEPKDSTNTPVAAIVGRPDGSVWVSLGDGQLLVFKDGSSLPTIIEAEEVPCSPVRSFYEDTSGVLWGGCQNSRLWRLNEKGDNWEFEQVGPTLGGQVTSIMEIAPGTLWVSGLGLGVWEVETGTSDRAVHYTRENGLLDVNVWDLTHDREGNIWVSQNTGLSKLRSNQAAFRYYTSHSYTGEEPALPGVEALAIQPDVRLRTTGSDTMRFLAVGSTEGLALIREDGAVEHITTEQGLSNNIVLGVCLDTAGRLWATTRSGVDLLTFGVSLPRFPSQATTQRTFTLFGKQATLSSSYGMLQTNSCGPLPLAQEAGQEKQLFVLSRCRGPA